MRDLQSDDLNGYVRAHTAPENELLQALARETYQKMSAPGMQIGHLQGAFMRLLLRMMQARRVLEIGTFTGYSALVMAEALPEDGELITCDIDPEATDVARRYWAQSPHGGKITLKLGPAAETIPTLEGAFDFAFLDADKQALPQYWELVLPKMRQGGVIAVDNVLMSGNVLAPQSDTEEAVHAFNEKVAADARVEAVMLPIRDGLTLAWKR